MASGWEGVPKGFVPRATREWESKNLGLGFTNRRLANTLGGPVDIVDWALQPLGIDTDEPFGGSKSIKRGMGFIGAEVAPEGAIADSYYERGMEELGSGPLMLLPGGAGTGMAMRSANPVVKRVAESLAKPFLEKPLRAMGGEAIASLGAGAGGLATEKEGQALGIDPALARLPGEFLGGVAGVSAGAVARRAFGYSPTGLFAREAAKTLAPYTKAGAGARVRDRMKGLVADPDAMPGRIDEETIAPLTPAQRTREAGPIALENRMRESDPVLNQNIADRNRENIELLQREMGAAGEGGKAADATGYLRWEYERQVGLIKGVLAQAREKFNNAMSGLEPSMLETHASTKARQVFDGALRSMGIEETRLWGIVKKDVFGPTGRAYARTAEIVADLSDSQMKHIPAEIKRYLLDPKGNHAWRPKESVRELHGTYSELREVARRALSDGKRQRARIANAVADAILEDIESVADVGSDFAAARNFSRTLNETFRQGRVGQILGYESVGGSSVSPMETLKKGLGDSGAAGANAADEVLRAVGGVPQADDAFRQFLRKQFSEAANSKKWLTDHAEQMDRFPELKREMEGALESGRVADVFDATIAPGLKEAEASATARFFDAPIHREFDTVVGREVKDPAGTARMLVRKAAGDPSGKATLGLKAAALDYLIRGSTKAQKPIGQRVRDILEDQRIGPAMREILGPKEMRRLARISRELDLIAQSDAPQRNVGGVMEDQVNSVIGFIGTTLGARSGAKLGGGISGASLKTASAGSSIIQRRLQGLTNNEAERMLRDAALDNDLYKMLFIPWTTPARITMVERGLAEYLGAEAGVAIGELQGREPASPPPAWTAPEGFTPRSEPQAGAGGNLLVGTAGASTIPDAPPAAADELPPEIALQRAYGGRLTINSAVRTQEENDAIPGAAEHSRHLASEGGDALDISTRGLSRQEQARLVRAASALGYGGISIYGGHIHVDKGEVRTWGTTPKWAKALMRGHLSGRFVK